MYSQCHSDIMMSPNQMTEK